MEDRYIVDTPENIAFAYDVAGIGSRFLAAIVDSLLLILLQLAVGAVLLFVGIGFDGNGLLDGSIALAIWSITSFLFFWGYYLVFELIWNGQSPGKRWLGLRTVREGGRPITFVASAVRNLIRVIDFLPGFYGIGVVTMFIDGRSRRLGDLAGGTLVVKEGRAVTLDSLTRSVEPNNAAAAPRLRARNAAAAEPRYA
ncbi:RDD family protein [Candidatus Gracilibacteria bacterium]|nr:RDD family protein [Candidatus Gracilibacteria bacterium]